MLKESTSEGGVNLTKSSCQVWLISVCDNNETRWDVASVPQLGLLPSGPTLTRIFKKSWVTVKRVIGAAYHGTRPPKQYILRSTLFSGLAVQLSKPPLITCCPPIPDIRSISFYPRLSHHVRMARNLLHIDTPPLRGSSNSSLQLWRPGCAAFSQAGIP